MSSELPHFRAAACSAVTNAEGRPGAERRAESSGVLDQVARLGIVTYGVSHLAVAWLVVRLALGHTSGAASGAGALQHLAAEPEGRVALFAVAGGFLALTAWQAVEAALGYRRRDRRQRVGLRLVSSAKVVIFALVSLNAVLLATGSEDASGTDGPTAHVMRWPVGPVLVGAFGLGIVVIAFFLARFGWKESFRDIMSSRGPSNRTGRLYVWLGKVGYLSRGAAGAMIGVLFAVAALTQQPRRSGGLDQVLNDLLATSFGSPVLVVLAGGLAAYGLFCFALARHLAR